MVKVLHVIPSLSAVHGGPSRAIGLIEQCLLAQGVAVETATTDDDGPGRHNGKACGVALGEDGVIRHYFRKGWDFYKLSPGFARWIVGNVRNYDIVHIHALFSFTSTVAAWAARRAGVPYVVRPLGTLNRYGVEQRRPWLKQLSVKLIEGPILRHAAAVHFTAAAEMQEAEALGVPLRGVVIPLGIEPAAPGDAAMFLANFPELKNCRLLLFLSRLDPKKNVEGLLRAFKLCSATLPDARLVIAGDGEAAYVAGLKVLADKLGLSDRVVWLGYVEGTHKADVLAAAQVFVLPSFSENFGIAAVEALLAGLPCVLGEGVAIAGEVAQAGAGLAVAPDPDSIARGLMTLLADGALRASMAESAAGLARERYSLAAMGERLAGLYGKIVSGERRYG